MDQDNHCCPAGVLSVSGVCCKHGAVLDAAGYCCNSGLLDVCGTCGGLAWTVDVLVSSYKLNGGSLIYPCSRFV
jgi:hypothetical protein